MAYTSEVIRRASQLLERRRTALKSQQRALRAEVYERIPEVRAIDAVSYTHLAPSPAATAPCMRPCRTPPPCASCPAATA